MKPIPVADASFWSRVSRSDQCWIWTGGRSQQGYGKWRGTGAHRVALNSCEPPSSLRLGALHHCDNPPCVRPDHLYWGTAKQNSRDMLDRHPRFQRPRRGSFTFRIDRRERLRIEALAEQRNESISDTVDYLLRKAIELRAEKKREAGQ